MKMFKEKPREYKRYGNVIMSWKTDRASAFAGLIKAFIKSPATIVDLCAGERRIYRKLNNGNTLTGKYKLIFGDIRKIEGNHYTCDILNPPKPLYGIADGFVFDPPWPSTSGSLKQMVGQYHPLTKEEFEDFLPKALDQIDRILKPAGILIVKISHPWNHVIYGLLREKFRWLRDIVQVSVNHGVYLVTYFMVFKKVN